MPAIAGYRRAHFAAHRSAKNRTVPDERMVLAVFARRVDIGGLEVSFSSNDHTGLEFVDLSIIGPDGKFRR